MYLIISTIPHFCSILPLIKYYKTYTFGYVNVIFISTILSMLYHIYEESNYTITYMDYLFAGLWGIYDIYMGYTYTNKTTLVKIVLANMISYTIYVQIPYNVNYSLNHSFWHYINACKCYYVSKCITSSTEFKYSPYIKPLMAL
jgi:hypothetical protein